MTPNTPAAVMMRLLLVGAAALAARTAPPPPAPDEIVLERVLLAEAAKTRGAVALDGSPALYYFKNTTSGTSSRKWHVYLEGGGWCESTSSCARRAKSVLGSSSDLYHDATLSLPSGCRCDGGGYFSSDPGRNPLMHDWNQVFVNYLDGGSFSGNQSKPDKAGDQQIYYRGRVILDAVLDDLLQRLGMAHATDIVLSGCSAGGQAIYLQADHVASKLPATAKFRTLADSGYFLAEGGTGHSFPWIFRAMNAVTDATCEAAEPDPSRCIFAQVVSKYVSTPVFALQSVVDNHQVCPGCSCDNCTAGNQQEINTWAHRLNAALISGFLTGPHASVHGGFIDTCDHHCGSWSSDASAPTLDVWINGSSTGQAFAAWYRGQVALDTVWQQPLPSLSSARCTSCCHKPAPPAAPPPLPIQAHGRAD